MRYCLITFLFVLLFGASAANATVDVSIDLTHQRMDVTSASGTYSWPISSGRAGYATPTGTYQPQAMYRMIRSRIYGNAPMPHSIFFTGGYAIHGTDAVGALGRPASHGCIRLAPGNAATLYQLVQSEGARITIAGAPPVSRVATSTRDTKIARSRHHHGTKYAQGKRHHGSKYAHSTRGGSQDVAANARPAPQPAPQEMMGLFGGGL